MSGAVVHVLHGVNLGMLGRRDPAHYGSLSLSELEGRVGEYARASGFEARFTQTDHEGEFCEALHGARDAEARALIVNPGAWTHYSYAIRDALEIAGLPAVEVHLSAVDEREEWRRRSVIRDLCVATVQGRGVEGYRDALEILRRTLEGGG